MEESVVKADWYRKASSQIPTDQREPGVGPTRVRFEPARLQSFSWPLSWTSTGPHGCT
jgi:hypothetical protein